MRVQKLCEAATLMPFALGLTNTLPRNITRNHYPTLVQARYLYQVSTIMASEAHGF